MRVLQLDATNFRSLKSASIRFSPEATVLVGPNNAGKTNILRALQLTLSADVGRMRDAITRRDFTDENRESEFSLTATLVGLTDDDIDTFGIDNLEPLDDQGNLVPDADDISVVDKSTLALRITALGAYDQALEEYGLSWWFAKHGERNVAIARAQRMEIGFQYLRGGEAVLPWALGLSTNSLIRRMLSKKGGSLAKEMSQVSEALDGLGGTLGGNDVLKSILEDVSAEIARILPLTDTPLHFGVGRRGGDEFVRGMELVGRVTDSSLELPLSAHGRGSTSAAAMMTVLLYATTFQGSLILALEEPEVALHPHLQRMLLQELLKRGVQVVLTTHSPVIAGACQPEQLMLVRKVEKVTVAKPLVEGTEKDKQVVEKDLNRLFADAVFATFAFVVEGETDAAFLQAVDAKLADAEKRRSLEAQGLSYVEAGGCSFIPRVVAKLKRIEALKIFALADSDPTQPRDSIRGWGVGCNVYCTWPQDPEAYDLEGILAFGVALPALADALSVVFAATDEKDFLSTVAGSAEAPAKEWIVEQVKNGTVSVRELVDKWQSDAHPPAEEALRKAIKRAMTSKLKHRRQMRLLASALPLEDVPEQILFVLRLLNNYVTDKAGDCVAEL